MLRNWLRKWLGLDAVNQQLYEIEKGIGELQNEVMHFTRCTNCDGIINKVGKAVDTVTWVEEYQRCPDCGGPLRD